MNTISYIKKWTIIILGVIAWNTSIAQESISVRLTEIPNQKSDNYRTPPNTERKRIPLGVLPVRKTAEGQNAILQKIDTPTRLYPVNEILTLQGCEGKSMSKEDAMRNGAACGRANR